MIKIKKGFTIIELIVIIATIGIIVIFGMPRLLGYAEKAQLTRIQHDIKIMENEMELALKDGLANGWLDWDANYKNLFNIVARQQLFEDEGVAKNVDMSYMRYEPYKGKFLTPDKGKKIVEGFEGINEKVNLGGPLVLNEGDGGRNKIEASPHTDYKIIPDNYKEIISTKLKGTFYVSSLGKVYYESDKPVSHKPVGKGPNCSIIPAPDYIFDHKIGRIDKYHGNAEHLVIPAYFLVDGECWPVRIIGKGAFMQGGYKSIIVPATVEIIEEDAFKDNKLDEVNIKRPEGSVDIGDGVFDNNGPNGDTTIEPTYKPSVDDNIIVKPERDEDGNIIGGIIISGGNNGSGGNEGSGGNGGSGGSGGNGGSGGSGGSGGIISIPDHIVVDGKKVPIIGIAKGAYQGQGLIAVMLPEGLERIEDYAFAGNQLTGITIPNSVNYIGNYAFAFNEVEKVGNTISLERKATIKTIIMKGQEQFNKINKYGDILENGEKLDILSVDYTNITLKNHIFVTSIGDIIIDKEYIEDKELNKWITIQKWEQLIDASKPATWFEPKIKDDIPEGTNIIYKYSTSDNQIEWTEEVENIKELPVARFLKMSIETQRKSNITNTPKILSISPIYEINGKITEARNIERHNEKINFDNYANIIYVDSLNGNDNNEGALSSPIKNINKAYNLANNGDLICLKDGEYILTVTTLTKKVDFYGLNEKTTLILNGPYQRPFNAGQGYLAINSNADSGFYNMIIETRGKYTYANFFYNKGILAFYNVVFNNFVNLDYTDFLVMDNGSMYLYNVTFTDSAARNLFIRASSSQAFLVFQNVYGNLTLDNTYSSHKIDVNILKDSMIVNSSKLDKKYNILENGWENTGLGTNPDGNRANIGVYGGPNAWSK